MTTDALIFSEIHELLALQRALLEARYCEIPNDPVISASPVLASIHRRILDAIISADLPAGLSPESWHKWLAIDEDRREWTVALNRAAQHQPWSSLSQDDKRNYAICLLTPFAVSEKLLNKFLTHVDDIVSGQGS